MQLKKNLAYIINEAIKIHGDKYGYDKLHANAKFTDEAIINCKIHGDFPQVLHNHIHQKHGCPDCGKIKQANSLLKYTEYDVDLILKNKNIKRLTKYRATNEKMKLECLICNHVWSAKFNEINGNRNCGCPKCNRGVLDNDKIGKFLIENNIPIIIIGDYKNSRTKTDWQCLICDHIWPAKSRDIMRTKRQGSGCPKCAKGKNEKIVGNFLLDNNIHFEKIRIKLPISKDYALPDFYIPSMNLIIEYNGVQHYKITKFGGQTVEDAKYHLSIKQSEI